jgi:alginate O-acetyltransferase complex protein AlgI
MEFQSFQYFIFFFAALILYYTIPWRIGRVVMVLASYLFYSLGNNWYYSLLLFGSTVIDYFSAIYIEKINDKQKSKPFMALSILMNIGALCTFKYGDFFINQANAINRILGIEHQFSLWHLVLPAGISFYTFQTLSYTLDVYRGQQKAIRNFTDFALYVAFFPQLIAGPIERARDLMPQLLTRQTATRLDLEEGFQRILVGLFKKVVLSDRLAVFISTVYAAPNNFSGLECLLASLAFIFALYLDFSAYTDMAIGSARMMGVKLSENFHWPLAARNPSEFMSSWHMSLTRWFRDYVHRSLGGVAVRNPWKHIRNVLIVMSLAGFWHGASWNYVLAFFMIGSSIAAHQYFRIYMPRKKKGPLLGHHWWSIITGNLLTWAILHPAMTCFRSPDYKTFHDMYTGIFTRPYTIQNTYIPYLFLTLALYAAHMYRRYYMNKRLDTPMHPALRIMIYVALLLAINFLACSTTVQFYYFQF